MDFRTPSEAAVVTDTANVRNVSNSEVTAFLACKRAYNFAFIDTIAPFETPKQLARGSVGHQFFEQFFEAKAEGKTYEECIHAGLQAFIYPREETKPDVLLNAQYICMRTMKFMGEEMYKYWEPLGIEETFHLPLTPTLNLTIRYDLYYRDIRNNKYKILDWKFSYDFWSLSDHDLNPQMPKYIGTLRANGHKVDEGILFEIRTRPLGEVKDNDPKYIYRDTPYRPSKATMRSFMSQHVRASVLIEHHRSLSPEDREAESIPVLNKWGPCKYCNFTDLCNSMNQGKTDLSVDIRVNYKQSTYGYNKTEAEPDPLEGL